jgi:F-type H+-transporting ATPase subunit delta
MKINKEVRRVGKQLFRACFVDDQFDQKKALSLVESVIAGKPRHYLGILTFFGRLVRLETEKRTATIETSKPLEKKIEDEVRNEIKRRYPQVLRTQFGVRPDLLAGMKIRVGSDVWDGTVRGKLDELKSALS